MRRIAFPALLVVALASGAVAHAQTTRQGGDTARLQAALQQLSSERTTLQGEKSKLEARVAELERQLAAAQGEKKSLDADLTRSKAAEQQATASGEQTKERLAQLRARTDELVARFRETATSLQQAERERGELQQQLAASTQQVETCSKDNVALYDTAIEVLDRYESKGMWSVMKQKEPFLQLKRVEIENLADDYRMRLDDGRYVGQGNGT